MKKRKLEDLNLLDDFLFGTMVTYPGLGELFSRELLKIIFQRDFGKLKIIAQKTYYGSDTDKHGVRLDLYMEEEETDAAPGGSIYDVEPNLSAGRAAVRSIPQRVRFYHAQIDTNILKAGEDYLSLKNVFVIVITPYDPFGFNRMLYTIRRGCEEEPLMPYDDGARTIFLYTKGERGNPPAELAQLLRYMENTAEENAVNESLQSLQQMVETVKRDKEVALEYMRIFDREQVLREEGREEERINTERERLRAETAEEEVQRLKEQLNKLQERLKQ